MEIGRPCCPECGAQDVRKHGQHLGKQRYYCKRCGFAFTGGQYRHRPARDITALKAENHRLRKCLEAGIRLNDALGAYLDSLTGKDLGSVKQKRERFSRLLADIQVAHTDIESIVELQEPGKLQDVSSTGYSTSNQGTLL